MPLTPTPTTASDTATAARAARRRLRRACARYTVALDGAGPARRGWFVARGAKAACWLGATATEAAAALRADEA